MITSRRFVILSALLLGAVLLPQAAHAISIWPAGYWAPQGIIPQECRGGSGCPPDLGLCPVFDAGQRIIYLMMSLLLFAIAPLLFVIGGGTILFAGADPGMLSQGKKILSGTLIGVAISLGAFFIVDQVFAAVASLSSVQINWRNIQCTPGRLPSLTP